MSTTALSLPRRFASLVKFEHTIFALPFAYVGAFLAVDGYPGTANLIWLTLAMIGARTLAMALNRLVDAELDARNPRTASREIPAGALTKTQVWALCAAALALYLVAAFQLEPIVRWLWPIPVAMFVVYPYLKRITWLCHLWLGACTGLAPLGAWLAVTGKAPWEAWARGSSGVTCAAGTFARERWSQGWRRRLWFRWSFLRAMNRSPSSRASGRCWHSNTKRERSLSSTTDRPTTR